MLEKNTVHITSIHNMTKTFHFTEAQKKFAVQKLAFVLLYMLLIVHTLLIVNKFALFFSDILNNAQNYNYSLKNM